MVTCRRVNSFTACRKAPRSQQGPWVGGGTGGGKQTDGRASGRSGRSDSRLETAPSQSRSLSVSCWLLRSYLPPLTPTRAPDSLLLICLWLLSARLRGCRCCGLARLYWPRCSLGALGKRTRAPAHGSVPVGAAFLGPPQSSHPKGGDEGIKHLDKDSLRP